MSVKQKYLKDENGEVFSPITSIESIYNSNGEQIPQIVAWCYATADSDSFIIQAGSNIEKIVKMSTGTYRAYFKTNIKDTFYSALVNCEVSSIGKEIIGIYQHNINYFTFDVTDYTGAAMTPAEVNIIVIR